MPHQYEIVSTYCKSSHPIYESHYHEIYPNKRTVVTWVNMLVSQYVPKTKDTWHVGKGLRFLCVSRRGDRWRCLTMLWLVKLHCFLIERHSLATSFSEFLFLSDVWMLFVPQEQLPTNTDISECCSSSSSSSSSSLSSYTHKQHLSVMKLFVLNVRST